MVNKKFHLAFPVINLEITRAFYTEILDCKVGRESEKWIDFNFFGHQITAHLVDQIDEISVNHVDKELVPVRHFGIILLWNDWNILVSRLTDLSVDFLIQPQIRFKGELGEQATLFISDPSKNALEFKSFRDPDALFRK